MMTVSLLHMAGSGAEMNTLRPGWAGLLMMKCLAQPEYHALLPHAQGTLRSLALYLTGNSEVSNIEHPGP